MQHRDIGVDREGRWFRVLVLKGAFYCMKNIKKTILIYYIVHSAIIMTILLFLVLSILNISILQVRIWHVALLYVVNMFFGNLYFSIAFKKNLMKASPDTYNVYVKLFNDDKMSNISKLLSFPYETCKKDTDDLKTAKKYLRHRNIIVFVGIIEVFLLVLILMTG